MKVFNKAYSVAAISVAMAFSASTFAKVSEADAAKLGKELTPVGAVTAGNADGTIPAWTGGITNAILGTDIGKNDRVTNPFAADKPQFVITAANVDQYKDNLTPGQLAMFKKYPETYKMPVYETRRSFAQPDDIYATIKGNALNASLSAGGNGLDNFKISIPFPIPENGLEVIWNHITRYRGGHAERVITTIPVQRNGAYTAVKVEDKFYIPEALKGGRDAKKDDNILFYYMQRIIAPARLTGTIALVHETIDQVKEPRKAWIYNSGQRRVRRAPNVSYDGEGIGVEGSRTSDNYDMYNGAPDRYNWTLIGKKELYIPYNSYDLSSTDLEYEDIVKPGHINQDYTRYEKHRVWEVQAKVKEGQRHVYAQRNFFIDEDSWQAGVIDHYDARGNLWRVAEAHSVQYYNADVNWFAAETLYDIIAGRYLVTGLNNEERKGIQFDVKAKRKDFSTSALKRMGR